MMAYATTARGASAAPPDGNRAEYDVAMAALQARGYRLTGARQAIIAALHDAGRYLTAQQLYEGLRGRSVGLASVYRTLELLVDLNLARKRPAGGGEAAYLASPDRRRALLTCTRCGLVRAIDPALCPTAALLAAAAVATDFALHHATLDFYGVCPACAAGAAPEASPADPTRR